MDNITTRYKALLDTLPEGVEMVAVSKFHPVEQLREAYEAGARLFGESRVQELVAKIPQLPTDIRWHFIGHLQSNKVRQLISTRAVALIESVDSEALLRRIDAEAERADVNARVLMQVHVAQEETKFGFTPDEILDFFRRGAYCDLRRTHICGIMGMASNTDDTARIVADFAALADIKRRIQQLCPDLRGFDTLSMGMSDDYPLAIAEGATLVRIGTALFGPRT